MTNKAVFGRWVVLSGFLALAPWASGQVGSGSLRRGVMPMRGAGTAGHAGPAAAAGPASIPYLGGAVIPNSTTYAIWWGKRSDFPSDALDGIDDFLKGLDGSAYLGLANEYMLGQTAHTRFGGNLFDSSAPPTQDPSVALVTAEIYKVLTSYGMKPSSTAIYMVYVSNSNENYYCAAHNYDIAPDGTNMHSTYIPNPTTVPGCQTNSFDPLFTPNGYSEGTRAMASSTAHEFMETITDPNGDAWADYSTGNEIGDPCNFIFQSWVPLGDSKWKIQEIWSNKAGGCVQGDGRPAQILGAVSSAGAVTTFNIPAAAYGIFSYSMNSGASTGFYTDASHEFHAFLRDTRGIVSTIDPPGTGPGFSGGAQALSINAQGAITGNYGDANFVLHGFVRDSHGAFTTIDVPGAFGTLPNSINAEGALAGDYFDANGTNHGFVRDSHGNFASFDAPGAAPSSDGLNGGTTVLSINGDGAVAGYYTDANSVYHGFVRDSHGGIIAFDAPGAANVPGQGTIAQSINAEGDIAGYYIDANFGSDGFVREGNGTFVTFDVPGAIDGTYAYSINASGAVAGYYSDASGFPHGFVRDNHGGFTSIDAPGKSYGTVLRSITDAGAVAGYHTAPVD